jgi:hypothetical protein
MSSAHPWSRSRRWPAIRPASVAAVCAAAAIAAAGCGSSGGGTGAASGGAGGATGAGAGSHAASAVQELTLAASAAQKVNSFAAHLTISSSGALATHLSGTLEEQVRPTLLASEKFSLQSQGTAVPGGMQTLLTGNAIYLKMSTLAKVIGKQWVKIPFSSLKKSTGISLAPLIHQLQGNNPLAQTQMLPAASDVHQVGTASIGGVSTTEYAGTLDIAKAMAKLAPSFRKLVGPALKATGITTANFKVWVDGQHQVRKLTETEGGGTTHFTTVMTIISVNQPVHITAPPASQVAGLPGM